MFADTPLIRPQTLQAMVGALAGLEPDLVVTTGDNWSEAGALQPLMRAWGRLRDVPGAFVFGSNDYEEPSFRPPMMYLVRSTEGKDGAHGPALRRSLLEALLAQRVELLASALGDEVVALAEEAVTATLTQLLASPRGAELRQGALVALCSAAGDHTLAAALPTEASRAALTALLAHLLGEPTS